MNKTYRVKEVLDLYQALVEKDFKVWIDRKEGINSNMNKEYVGEDFFSNQSAQRTKIFQTKNCP